MARKGLGKGLDSLIPDFYNEDFDSNSTQSLEDLLKEDEEIDDVEVKVENDKAEESKNIFEEIKEEKENDQEDNNLTSDIQVEEVEVDKSESEDLPSDKGSEESLQDSQEAQRQKEHVAEVKEIVDKNPRITLWSSRSSAVFRYLRKSK